MGLYSKLIHGSQKDITYFGDGCEDPIELLENKALDPSRPLVVPVSKQLRDLPRKGRSEDPKWKIVLSFFF